MTAQLALLGGPVPDVEVVDVEDTFLRDEAEVATRWRCIVHLGERAPGDPLVTIESAVVIDTGDEMPADERAQMLANDDFRQSLKGRAYSDAVRQRQRNERK